MVISKVREKGQGLVETALLFPVLLIVLSGLIEVGFMLNDYLAIMDAARNAARFSADSLFDNRDITTECTSTRDFYRQAICLVCMELDAEKPSINGDLPPQGEGLLTVGGSAYDCPLDNTQDEILVTAFSVLSGSTPSITRSGGDFPNNGFIAYYNNGYSPISNAQISAALDSNAPSTGYVIVEIYYNYRHKLNLPWVTMFMPNPFTMHSFTIMPLVSAEPTSTPIP